MDARAQEAIGRLLTGRRVLVISAALAGVTPALTFYSGFDADVRSIAAVPGVGELPEIDFRLLGGTPGSIMSGMWAFERAIRDLAPEVVGWLDEWDPDRSALVIAPTVGDFPEVGGRRAYGAQRPEWRALENKIVIDQVWDDVGVVRAPSDVVPVRDAVRSHGVFGGNTVWVADNRDGWHGGADRVRWIQNDAQLANAIAFFAEVADVVRVMPFLDGVPCSIHGYVLPHRVHVFRPVELLMLRDRLRGRFVYGSVGTTWDPLPGDREEMRSVAKRVGEHLLRVADYRGAFSVDGVMTVDGFRPTELNPRLSAGFGIQLRDIAKEFPIGTLTRMLIEGDLDPAILDDLESRVVPLADERRIGRVVLTVDHDVPADKVLVRVDGRHLRLATGEGLTTVEVGPGPSGSVVMALFDDVSAGRRMGPLALAVAEFARDHWGLDLGALEVAPDVRLVRPGEPEPRSGSRFLSQPPGNVTVNERNS